MGYNNISPRKTGFKQVKTVKTFNIPSQTEVLKHFTNAIADIRYIKECAQKTSAYSCLLRSSVVMVCSAFDLYLHELFYMSFFFMRNGQINHPSYEFNEFKKQYSQDIIDNNSRFYTKLMKEYGYITMSNPNKFVEALDHMGITQKEEIYISVLKKKGIIIIPEESEEKLKQEMRSFYLRRNLIAHSYDYDLPGGQEEINDEFVTEYVELLSNIVDALAEYINREWS